MSKDFSRRLPKRPFSIAAFLFSLALIMVGSGCTKDQKVGAVPPDFQLVAEVDLSTQSHDKELLGEFTLMETAVTTIFYTLPNANTPYFDLSLIGPKDESQVILHSESYRTDESGGGTWEQNLLPGTYRLELTTDPGSGVLSVYWRHS